MFRTLWKQLRDENWFRHVLTFIGTILGIIIGIQIERSIGKASEREKVEAFKTLVENELKLSRQNLALAKRVAMRNITALTFIKAKRLNTNPYRIDSLILDSLFRAEPAMRNIVNIRNTTGSIREFEIQFQFQSPDVSKDAWEAFKESGLLSEMSPMEIMYYTNTYTNLRNDLGIPEQTPGSIISMLERAGDDKVFNEAEITEVSSAFEMLVIAYDFRIKSINGGFQSLKAFRENPDRDEMKINLDTILVTADE